jgi:hypothetical protein
MSDFVDVQVINGGTLTVQVAIPKPLRVVDEITPPPNHGILQIMNQKDGDKRVVWDSNSLAEIRAAKEMFDDLVRKGLEPYRVGHGGKAGLDKMSEFDPMAEQVMFLPMKLAGGG